METQQISTKRNKLTPKQIEGARMIIEGVSLRDIAKKLKIRHETVTRWKLLPLFQEECRKLTEEKNKAREEDKKLLIKAREEMRTNMHHEITFLMKDAIDTVTSQFNNSCDDLSDRSKLAFDVLKFLKADQLWGPPST